MNRFFRSAFSPLIVIVLLVWLASQTLIPKHSNAVKLTYSEVIAQAKSSPETFTSVDFNPAKRQWRIGHCASGKSATVHYPSDQSQVQFQDVLQKQGIKFDSKGTGGFSWTALIGSFLPYLLLIGFWIS